MPGRLFNFFIAAFNLWGLLEQPVYDVIVVGAGAAGCPLAQTLAEGGLKVLLLERGGERVESSKTLIGSVDALSDKCAESLRSKSGVTVVSGNCMGGATSVNHGIYVQEQPEWVQNATSMDGSFAFNTSEIVAAYDWIRERVAPEPTTEPPGSASETYVNSVVRVYQNRTDFIVGNNVVSGQPFPPDYNGNVVWRTHSTFHPTTGARRSSDTILDRDNENLEIRTNAAVSKVLFDGEAGVPTAARVRATTTPRARCVRLESGEVLCVKPQGRIYLSSGAIHTPEILLKSGIGPSGNRVDNPLVGQNFVDKPAILVAGSFPHEFPNDGELYFSHIAATQKGATGTVLYEELNAGIDAMLPLSIWQRNFVPTSLRNSFFANSATALVKFCRQNIRDPLIDAVGPSPLCNQIEPIVKAGCDRQVFGYGVLSGEPTSRGSVELDAQGGLSVDVGYMTTSHDRIAMGKAVRVAFEMLTSHTGPTAPQRPCVDKNDKVCMSKSCPDLIADYVVFTKKVLRLVMPLQANKFKSAPASVAYPQPLEPALADPSNTDEDIGDLISDEIFAAHHFAGTSAVGNVVGIDLQVLGVAGLYVVDASALHTTPRANPMATVLALGRLAGLHAVRDLKER